MSHTHNEPNLQSSPSTPRWVKVFGIFAVVVVLLIGIMLLVGGEHGPGRHMPPLSVTEIHTPSVERHGQQP